MKIETYFVYAVKAQTNGQITFEYAACGLRIRPANKKDHAYKYSNLIMYW